MWVMRSFKYIKFVWWASCFWVMWPAVERNCRFIAII